jgi:hypothetical protein
MPRDTEHHLKNLLSVHDLPPKLCGCGSLSEVIVWRVRVSYITLNLNSSPSLSVSPTQKVMVRLTLGSGVQISEKLNQWRKGEDSDRDVPFVSPKLLGGQITAKPQRAEKEE